MKGYAKLTAALVAVMMLFIAIGVSSTSQVSAQAATITVVPTSATTLSTGDTKKNNTTCSVITGLSTCAAGDNTYKITVNDQGRTSDDTRMETITVTVKNADLATVTGLGPDANAKTITLVETNIATDIFERTVTTKHATTGLQHDVPVVEVTTATNTTTVTVLGWDGTAGNDSIDGDDIVFTDAMRAVIVAAGVAQPVNVVTHADNKILEDSRDITAINSSGVVTIAATAAVLSVGDRLFVPGVAVETKAFSGNTLTATYKPSGTLGISKSITVDNVKSSVVVNAPAIDLITKKAKTVNFNVDVTDSGAGFPSKTSSIVSNNAAGTKGRIQLFVGSAASGAVTTASTAYSAITDGYNLSHDVSSTDISNIASRVPWWVEAEDLAGNVKKTTAGYKGNTTTVSPDAASVIDSALIGMGTNILNTHELIVYCSGVKSAQTISGFNSSTGDITVDANLACTPALNQEYELQGVGLITVDSTAPLVSSAANVVTGHNWSSVKPAGTRLRTEAALADKDTSIRVTFTDASGLLASTVTPASFSVAGNTVESVLLVDTVGENAATPVQRIPNDVFLTLGTALTSNARPNVSIIGGTITDKAGNAVVSGTFKSTDKLGVGLTASLSATLSKKEIKVTITADEQLLAAPTQVVKQLTSATNSKTLGGAIGSTTMTQTGALTYSHKTTIAQAPGAIGSELLLYYTADDTGSNTGKLGHATDGAAASAIVVEFDESLNGGQNPKVSVSDKVATCTSGTTAAGACSAADGPKVESVDPMIVTVDWNRRCATLLCSGVAGSTADGESKEYARDSYKTVTLTSAKLKVTFSDGTYETTTFDLASDITSPDNKRFTIPVKAPKVGKYELSVKAVDVAGNDNLSAPTAATAQTLKWTWQVTAALPVKLGMSPGWNLISLPFQPANPAINSVIPSTHPADIVMTFDNASQVWLVSRRDADTGNFAGDVTAMTSNTAYFVRTDNFQEISILRPPTATAAAAPPPPPAIAVVPGWNLVPVVSLSTPLPYGIEADNYFGTLQSGSNKGWLKAMTFDPLARTWTSVTPATTTSYVVGAINPCTNAALVAADVAAQTEPCQSGAHVDTTAGNGFNTDDTVALSPPVLIGKGYWLYATAAGVVIP